MQIIFKRFLFYFGFALFSSLFSIIVATLAIFWIPQLREINSFLNFGFRIKEIIESYLPRNWNLPIPDIFQNKKMYVLSLGFLGLPILTFFYPIWFSNLLNYLDITPYLGIFSRPIKGLLTYCIYWIASKFTKDSSFYELPKIEWKNVFKVVNNKEIINDSVQARGRTQDDYILDLINFLDYLYIELNLFYHTI